MNICSVTLAGPGTESIIGDAIRSAVWCDWHLILPTGSLEENEAVYQAAVTAATRPLVRHDLPWQDDFAAMRNAAIEQAALGRIDWLRGNRIPADWMVWLDTDERLVCPDPKLLRQTLREFPQVDAVSAPHLSGEYHKDRMLRLPPQGAYVGPTHEYWAPTEEKPVLRVGPDLLAFDELPRDPDTLNAKMERDERILRGYIDDHSNEARWKYFLGQTLYILGRAGDAADWWVETCRTADDTATEIRGWAAFRAAEVALKDDPGLAISRAMMGLRIYPASPELFWLLATAHLNLGKPRHALHWAHLCLAAGTNGGGPRWERSGFQWLPAWHEAPFEVSALALTAMGDDTLAAKATEMAERIKAARETG